MAEKCYLSIDYTSGNFYENSKEPREGFEEHQAQKTGKISYRRYHPGGVFGKLMNAGIRTSPIGDQCSITLMSEAGDVFYISMGIYTADGGIENNFMEKLISLLPNLNKGEEYLLYPFAFTPAKKEGDTKEPRMIRGITIKNANNDKIEKAYTNAYKDAEGVVTEGDIPYLDFAQRPDGKIRPTAVTQELKTNKLIELMLLEIGKEGRLVWQKGDPSTGSGESKYTPLGKSVPVENTAPQQTAIPPTAGAVKSEPVIVYQQETPKQAPTPLGMQPNKGFDNPINVTIVTTEDLDDDDLDMPF